MNKRKLDIYELSIRLTVDTSEYGHPQYWNWATLLDLGVHEEIEILKSEHQGIMTVEESDE